MLILMARALPKSLAKMEMMMMRGKSVRKMSLPRKLEQKRGMMA